MSNPYVQTGTLVHSDDRRSIGEVHLQEGGSVQTFEIHQNNARLGDHFHRNKDERFILARGTAKLRMQRVSQAGEALDDMEEFALTAPAVITVPRLCAHTFFLIRGSVMICESSVQEFDPNDMLKFIVGD